MGPSTVVGSAMKIWIAMPLDWESFPPQWGCDVSIGSMPPRVTMEMHYDGIGWFEAEVLGPAPESRIKPDEGYR